jgi:hypothetical protein
MCVGVGVGVGVTIYTFDDGSAAQECVFLRAQRASLRHTAAGIPQGGGGVCGSGGGVVGIGVGGESRRSGEEEAGGLGRRQHHPSGCRASRDWRCVCVCVCVFGVYWS